MANKKKRQRYEHPEKYREAEVRANPKVLEFLDNYYRSNPDLYSLGRNGYTSTLDKPQVVQPVAYGTSVQSLWSGYRDYFRDGQYLGRVTVDEGEIISMELKV